MLEALSEPAALMTSHRKGTCRMLQDYNRVKGTDRTCVLNSMI